MNVNSMDEASVSRSGWVSQRRLVAAGAFLGLVWVGPAEAYVDPGTGSMMLQLFGAAIVGAIFYLRDLRVRLKGFFERLFACSEHQAPAESAAEEK